METDKVKFPRWIVWAVIVLSAIPFLLKFRLRQWGLDFSPDANSVVLTNVPGSLVHTLLEWSAICVALCTVAFAFTHFSVKRDVTSQVIGTALFFSAMIDVFQIIAADGLSFEVKDHVKFVGLTWAMSRTFYVCLLIAGTLPFVGKRAPSVGRSRTRGTRFMIMTGLLFVVMSYALTFILASAVELPKTFYSSEEFPIPRPWDILPLVLFLIAGSIVFPLYYKANPSLFSLGLIVSVIPNVAAQIHMAWGSSELYDDDFNIALFLKVVAYLVPLAGLILDYTRAYRTEVTLRMTEEKLRVARSVQRGLLPKSSPVVDGYDFAGCSYAADAVGGDYFDYLPMREGRMGVVVADVSGHEIGASILMAQTRAYLRALWPTQHDIGAIMTQINGFLGEDVQNRWFVTMFLVKLNPQNHTFVYTAAGHESYLIGRSGKVTNLESTSPPLGVLDKGAIGCGSETKIEPGDILLLMTDGIQESAAPSGEQFGFDRILKVVADNRNRSAQVIVDALIREAATFRAEAPQVDDLTLVVLKRNAQS